MADERLVVKIMETMALAKATGRILDLSYFRKYEVLPEEHPLKRIVREAPFGEGTNYRNIATSILNRFNVEERPFVVPLEEKPMEAKVEEKPVEKLVVPEPVSMPATDSGMPVEGEVVHISEPPVEEREATMPIVQAPVARRSRSRK